MFKKGTLKGRGLPGVSNVGVRVVGNEGELNDVKTYPELRRTLVPPVCAVVVTNNHVSYIARCIESIINADSGCPTQIVIVDNDSTDGTKDELRLWSEKVRLIQREGKHSLSNNLNAVLRKERAEYFLVLNPDVELPPNSIAALYHFMEGHQDAGACAPKLLNPDGSLQLSCRRFPTPATFLVRRTPLRWLLAENKRGTRHLMAGWGHDRPETVDWVLGGCVMFRSTALRHVGYFDERFRLYCEDIDICHRLWEEGWAVYYYPGIAALHNHQRISDSRFLSRHVFWHYQSMLSYVLKHGMSGFRRPLSPANRAEH
jgi:GT2 family glycosyltransferase